MTPQQFIESVREKYVTIYRQEIRKARQEGNFVGAEVSFKAPAQAGDDQEPRTMTFDLITGEGEDSRPILIMGTPTEGPLVGALPTGTIEVAVFPFLWESCPVWFKHADPEFSALEKWFAKWFEERDRLPDEDGLMGIVHYMSAPIAEGGGYLFEVDFGSAPAGALYDLLQALEGMGATEVRLGYSDGSDMEPDIAEELKSESLTQDRMTELVAELFREIDGVRGVTIAGPMTLNIDHAGMAEACIANLANLWLVLQNVPPEQRPRQVAGVIRSHLESSQYGKSGERPGLEALRPVIKPTAFINHTREMAERQNEQKLGLMCARLTGDLWISLVWDRPNGMQFVLEHEPEEFGLTREEAFARALKNYLDAPRSIETTAEGPAILARTHDNYDATLLLDDGFWSSMAEKMPGEILACAPTRDAVLITSTGTAGGERQLRKLAEEMVERGNHAISVTVLRRRNNVWTVQEEKVAAPPGAFVKREAPVVKKKPWWKFW